MRRTGNLNPSAGSGVVVHLLEQSRPVADRCGEVAVGASTCQCDCDPEIVEKEDS